VSEKALRKDLEDKVSDLEKELLLNKAKAEDNVLTLQTKVCQLEAQVAKYKEVEFIQEQEWHTVKTEISKCREKYETDLKKCSAQLHTAQENLESEKALRKDLEDKVSVLEKELFNKAKAEDNVLTLRTRVCQCEAQVAEYEEVQEQEKHAVQMKVSKLTRKCVKDLEESAAQFHSAQKDLEIEKSARNDLGIKIVTWKKSFLLKQRQKTMCLC
jgi:hypothetical protein